MVASGLQDRSADLGSSSQRFPDISGVHLVDGTDEHTADIRLESVSVTESTLTCEFTTTGGVRRFFTGEPFVADYGVDLTGVPECLLVIPWLANVCPVAWAAGVDVSVPVLDRRFAESLSWIRRSIMEMHSAFMTGGQVRTSAFSEPTTHDGDGAGLLFSGGVDSVTSYIRHRAREPELLTVHGTDVFLDQVDAWEGTRQTVQTFAKRHGLQAHFIRANMRHFLDRTMLQAHYGRFIDHLWYSSVQQGLGLLGLCAPLAHARGIETLLIGSSQWQGRFCEAWGSHPDIDDFVAWSGTDAEYDAMALTRQEKIEYIAEYSRSQAERLTLRTCFWDDSGGNCNSCEKCARTIAGLTLAGLDPEAHGYRVDRDTFPSFRSNLERGAWHFEESHAAVWADLQDHVANQEYPVVGATDFFEWLRSVDVYEFAQRQSRSPTVTALHAVTRRTPYPVYATLYPIYDRWYKSRYGSIR